MSIANSPSSDAKQNSLSPTIAPTNLWAFPIGDGGAGQLAIDRRDGSLISDGTLDELGHSSRKDH
jgi:hypothetical protein